jgi:hypothetical protein
MRDRTYTWPMVTLAGADAEGDAERRGFGSGGRVGLYVMSPVSMAVADVLAEVVLVSKPEML